MHCNTAKESWEPPILEKSQLSKCAAKSWGSPDQAHFEVADCQDDHGEEKGDETWLVHVTVGELTELGTGFSVKQKCCV